MFCWQHHLDFALACLSLSKKTVHLLDDSGIPLLRSMISFEAQSVGTRKALHDL